VAVNSGNDLVALNRGQDTLAVLPGQSVGNSFGDPQPAEIFPTGPDPLAVVAGDFTDSGRPEDLAILNGGDAADPATIWIYTGDGKGGFVHTFTLSAGSTPTGLSVTQINGRPALLVGNTYGDLLELFEHVNPITHKGDGTFRPPEQLAGAVALAVTDLYSNGQSDFITASQDLDQLAIQFGGTAPRVFQSQADGLLAPSAVRLVPGTGTITPDLAVANSGNNDVLLYQFDPTTGQYGLVQTCYVGTDPVGLTVADINGDGIPDLVVANRGSNDLSLLIGQGQRDALTSIVSDYHLTNGERLSSGGLAPTSTVVEYYPGRANPSILAVNSQSNDVALLPGVGLGFFNDQNPITVAVGINPFQIVPVPLPDDPNRVAVINSGSNDLTLLTTAGDRLQTLGTVASGGTDPVAAAVETLEGTDALVVANHGNGVIALLLEEGDSFDLAGLAELAQVTDVAAAASGVYATTANSDFVVWLPFVPVLTELPPSVAVAQPTGLEQSIYLLVPVLLQGELLEQLPLSLPEASPGEETFVLFLPPGQVLNHSTAAPLGDEPAEAPVAVDFQGPANVPESDQLQAFRLGVEEALLQYRISRWLTQQIQEWLEVLEEGMAPFKDMVPWEPNQGGLQAPADRTNKGPPESDRSTPATGEDAGAAAQVLPEEPESLEATPSAWDKSVTPQTAERQGALTLAARPMKMDGPLEVWTEPADELFARVELLPASSSMHWPSDRAEDPRSVNRAAALLAWGLIGSGTIGLLPPRKEREMKRLSRTPRAC